jgi:hypothetical protein
MVGDALPVDRGAVQPALLGRGADRRVLGVAALAVGLGAFERLGVGRAHQLDRLVDVGDDRG